MPPLPEWSDPTKREAALRRLQARLAHPDPLAPRELAVVLLESHGVPPGLMAEWLGIVPSSVKTYMRQARWKLAANTSAHAVATAIRLGIIE